MSHPAKPGLVLINLGTPDAPQTPEVRRYLREFLMDARVVDLAAVPRWMLVNLAILPFRPAKSAGAYRKIWTQQGSPLLVNSRALAVEVSRQLAGEYEVELAMRYGNPSIASAVDALKQRGVTHLTALPLYPQYAASSTASSVDELMRVLRSNWDTLPLRVLPAFYDHPGFLDVFAEVTKAPLEKIEPDHVLFSFHGLPERQIKKSDPSGQHCLSSASCCDTIGPHNERCYRAQSYFTARELASRLRLPAARWSVGFQSRLGRTPWIQPFTDYRIDDLARAGVKRLAIVCPSFVADCLETLEEIDMRAREQFTSAGGEGFAMVPSLNAHPAWVDAVVQMVCDGAPGEPLGRAR